MYLRIFEQAAPYGADTDFDSGGHCENGFYEIYSEFHMRDLPVESDVCRGRIFLRRCGNSIFYLTEEGREHEDSNAYE